MRGILFFILANCEPLKQNFACFYKNRLAYYDFNDIFNFLIQFASR